MARAKQSRPYDKNLTKVPTNLLTWKTVILVWLFCALPTMAGTGYYLYQLYPAPFKKAYAAALWAGGKAKGQYDGWQAKRKAAAAEEARKKKAAEADEGGDSPF